MRFDFLMMGKNVQERELEQGLVAQLKELPT
jgi:hypothetical protein